MAARDALPEISPFHEIEVWCTFTRRWVPGFWLDGLEPDGSIRLRRGIDQAPLSGSVPADSVRTRQVDPVRVIDLRATCSEPSRQRAVLPAPSSPANAEDAEDAEDAESVESVELERGVVPPLLSRDAGA